MNTVVMSITEIVLLPVVLIIHNIVILEISAKIIKNLAFVMAEYMKELVPIF